MRVPRTGIGLLAVLPLMACGNADQGDERVSPDLLAHALNATAAAKTAQISLSGTVKGALDLTMEIGAVGVVGTIPGDHEAQLMLKLQIGSPLYRAEGIVHEGRLWITGNVVPIRDGKEWMEVDVDRLSMGHDLVVFDVGATLAAASLTVLHDAEGDVEKIGSETVLGVDATRYRVALSHLDEPAEFWLDAQNRVVRMHVTTTLTNGAILDATIDVLRYGAMLAFELPPADDVYDGTRLVRRTAKKSMLAG